MEAVNSILNVTLVFFNVLIAATIIERLLEFISILIEFFEPIIWLDKLWGMLATKIQRSFIRQLEQSKHHGHRRRRLILKAVKSIMFKNSTTSGVPVVIRIDLVRKIALRIIMQVIGIIFGISIAFQTNMDVFQMVNKLGITDIPIPAFWSVLITGILIGSGTSPVHSIIKYAEDLKENEKRNAEIAEIKARLNP